MNNFLILMSGGTTPVINSTLSGILKIIKKRKNKIFVGSPGIKGVLDNNLINLSNISNLKIKKIGDAPGSHFFGTSRVNKLNNLELKKFKTILYKRKITNIINIGGNGTLQQSINLASKLPELNFVSCPKTVDNDLGDKMFNKMLFNPGFISSVYIWKFFLEMINIENLGACSHDKIIISQTFGRDTGFICGSIRYWDRKNKLPIMLLLPEDKKNFSYIFSYAKKILKKKGRLMIFISEGYKIGNIKPTKDASGQIMYGSSGSTNCQLLSNKFNKNGIQSRIFNPTILQRVFKFRDQNVSKKDMKIAEKIGVVAVKALLSKKKSLLVGLNKNHKIDLIEYKYCKKFTRKMPNNFIHKNKFDVSKKYLKYLDKVLKR